MISISIIIPIFNLEKYLEKALDSILKQTFKEFELICVDDGSTDLSLDILKKYKNKDNRIKILTQTNQGAGAARNYGLSIATGKYVQFLDGDDYFESNMLEILYNKAEEYSADLIVCSAKKIDENDNITEINNPNWPINIDIAPIDRPFNWKDCPNNIFNLFCVIPWNKLLLREMLLKNNLKFQNITSSNDIFFGHMAKIFANKIIIINEPLIYYRYNRKGSISEYRANSAINVIYALKKIKEELIKNNIYKILKNDFDSIINKHISAEISRCNETQFSELLKKTKEITSEEFAHRIKLLRKDFITPKYISNFIGKNKTFLWGASIFLRKILEQEDKKNLNILGIIDKNTASWGKKCGNYTIYSPDILKKYDNIKILMTVFSSNEKIYPILKKELKDTFPNAELLPNIFEKQIERYY